MERQEIIAKSEEVVSLIPFGSKQYLEDSYKEMATELLDAKLYNNSLEATIYDELGEEGSIKVHDKVAEIYENEFSTEEEKISPEVKAVLDKLFAQ